MEALTSRIIAVIGRVRIGSTKVIVRWMHMGLSIHGVIVTGGDRTEL
jgi:hypothetical protein